MSARVFVHPRCHSGPALGALSAMLEAHGYDMQQIFIGPKDARGRRELVRMIDVQPDFGVVFERMDGSRVVRYPEQPAPFPPEAA